MIIREVKKKMARVNVVVAGRPGKEEVQASTPQELANLLAMPQDYELRFLKGEQVLAPDTELQDGDEVTIVPTLSGA
jgi:molybdopterin converting factor small subunit